MNIQNMKYILALENQGSVSSAAKSLYISQPYLSKILQETEEEYGITIFRRDKKGITHTEGGITFLPLDKKIVAEAEEVDRRLQAIQKIHFFQFSACCSSHIADAFLSFYQKHASDSLRIFYRESDNYSVINDVATHASEIGFLILSNSNLQTYEAIIQNHGLFHQKLYDMKLHLIARVGHPLSRLNRALELEDILSYNFVLYPNRILTDSCTNGFSQYEYAIQALSWKSIKQITYVFSRAAYHDIILRTDTLSFGFQPVRNQETSRGLVSLPLSSQLIESIHGNADSSMYYICDNPNTLSPLSKDFINLLQQMEY